MRRVSSLSSGVCRVVLWMWSASGWAVAVALGNVCCRCAASSSVVRASVPKVSAALRIPPTLSPPTRMVQSLSAWTQWWAAAIASPAAISTPLCTSKPISRPHSLGLPRYALLPLLYLLFYFSRQLCVVFLTTQTPPSLTSRLHISPFSKLKNTVSCSRFICLWRDGVILFSDKQITYLSNDAHPFPYLVKLPSYCLRNQW